MYLKAVLLEILILATCILQHAPQNVEILFNTAQTTPVLCMFFIKFATIHGQRIVLRLFSLLLENIVSVYC